MYDIREALRQHQSESAKKRKEDLEKAQEEQEKYLESEQYKRDVWEAGQDAWERKAKKEGWTYERKPFIGAIERKRMEQQTKEQEIAYLREKISQLESDM